MEYLSNANGILTIETNSKETLKEILTYIRNQTTNDYYIALPDYELEDTEIELEELLEEKYKNNKLELNFYGFGETTIAYTLNIEIKNMIEKINIEKAKIMFNDIDFEPDCDYFVEEQIVYDIENSKIKSYKREAKELEISVENLKKKDVSDFVFDFTRKYFRELIKYEMPNKSINTDKLYSLLETHYISNHKEKPNYTKIVYTLDKLLDNLEIEYKDFEKYLQQFYT